MAIYHCSVKTGGRSKGQSAVAASAYRSGEKLEDKEIGEVFDYTQKSGVVYSEIALCENAPAEYSNREVLWNEVHKVEKSKDARLWREIEVAIPRELSEIRQIEAVREYVQGFIKVGMCADWSIHNKGDGNPHAHIMLTTRAIKANGEWATKEKKDYARDEHGEKIPIIDQNTGLQKIDGRNCKQWKRVYVQANDWNNRERVEEWREAWAVVCNKYLSADNKIDHRSYKRQGIDKIPTIHEGYMARKLEAYGEVSERCEINREIKAVNRDRANINADFKRLSAMTVADERQSVYFDNTFGSLIEAQNEVFRQYILLASARSVGKVNREKIGFADKMQKKVDELPDLYQNLIDLRYDIGKCVPIIHRDKKANLQSKYSKAYESLENAIELLAKGGVSRYHNNYRLDPDNIAKENIDELIRRAVRFEIPRAKREETEELNNIKRLKAAQGLSQDTLQAAYKEFNIQCGKVPPEYREAAYNTLQSHKLPIVNASISESFYIKNQIEETLKKHGIKPKSQPKADKSHFRSDDRGVR